MHPHSQREIEADGITLKSLLHIDLWGSGPTSYDEFINVNRDLEQKIKELSGMKWQYAYAHTYYSEGEFWDLFNREWKNSLRKKHDANSLPSVYEQVKVDVDAMKRDNSSYWRSFLSTWLVSRFHDIKKAINSGSYLDARKSAWRSIVIRTEIDKDCSGVLR